MFLFRNLFCFKLKLLGWKISKDLFLSDSESNYSYDKGNVNFIFDLGVLKEEEERCNLVFLVFSEIVIRDIREFRLYFSVFDSGLFLLKSVFVFIKFSKRIYMDYE